MKADYRTQKESKSYAEIAEPKNIATTNEKQNFRRYPIGPQLHDVERLENRNTQFLRERLARARAWDAD